MTVVLAVSLVAAVCKVSLVTAMFPVAVVSQCHQ